jgi:serine phosphatase RsbU (regulator of sigma subunit)
LITAKRKALPITLACIGASLLIAHLVALLLPTLFQQMDERALDRLFRLRDRWERLRPAYDAAVVHVDLNNTSKAQLKNYYADRGHHAHVIRNLKQMDVARVLYDFIFAAPMDPALDQLLVSSTRQAGNVYYGVAFRQLPAERVAVRHENGHASSEAVGGGWDIAARGDLGRIFAVTPFAPLDSAARGLGFLNLVLDPDGVYRRVPLLVRHGDVYYPSLAFRVACDCLGVGPDQVLVENGRRIILRDARRLSEAAGRDIEIPIDRHGNMRVNFVGPWGRMEHYNFSDILRASEDRDELELWREVLGGRTVVVSEVATGVGDTGPVPTDQFYPLSGVHANALNTILTGAFLREIDTAQALLIEFILALLMFGLCLRATPVSFALGSFVLGGIYVGGIAWGFVNAGLIFPVVRPLLFLGLALVSVQVISAVVNARFFAETQRARQLAERDLEIGRQIQTGFLPANLPEVTGWKIDALFKPARQVAGDFYDCFELPGKRRIAVVTADVCDKGVGAALFMALIRSLFRAFVSQQFDHVTQATDPDVAVARALRNAVLLTNNYLVENHGEANMFATFFAAVLDPQSGLLIYINAGHEPPLLVASGAVKVRLRPSGPAIGMWPQSDYVLHRLHMGPGDILLVFTDGIIDAQNLEGEFFSRRRLEALAVSPMASLSMLVEHVRSALATHMGPTSQYDDITLLAVQRGVSIADS